MDKPGLKLVESHAPHIVDFWRALQQEHPECDDFVALLEDRPEGVSIKIGSREAFVGVLRESGRWTDDSTWDALLKPAGLSAIWVVVHLQGQSAITRLVNPPLVSKGGSA